MQNLIKKDPCKVKQNNHLIKEQQEGVSSNHLRAIFWALYIKICDLASLSPFFKSVFALYLGNSHKKGTQIATPSRTSTDRPTDRCVIWSEVRQAGQLCAAAASKGVNWVTFIRKFSARPTATWQKLHGDRQADTSDLLRSDARVGKML